MYTETENRWQLMCGIEHMKASELQVGHLYFDCGRLTDAAPAPSIEVWVYDGVTEPASASDSTDETLHRFLSPEWYFHNTLVSALTPEQAAEYSKPEGPTHTLVRHSEIETRIFSLEQFEAYVDGFEAEAQVSAMRGA